MKSKKSAFTLVELIVVIVILAILATIAFLAFSSQSANARDSTRMSDMTNIAKGLSINYITAGRYPSPDSPITVSVSGLPILTQGYAGTSVLNMIKLSNGGKDPIDKTTYYTYSTNSNQSKYQVLGFLENGDNVALSYNPGTFSLFTSSFADPSSYSDKFGYTKGDPIGILLSSGSKLPAQIAAINVDLATTVSDYMVQFTNKNTIVGSGSQLAALKYIAKTGFDESLLGYWDMESLNADGKLIDQSGNGYLGTLNGTMTLGNYSGTSKTGKAALFDGVDDSITLAKPLIMGNGNWTISAWVKTSYAGTSPQPILSNISGGPVTSSFTLENNTITYWHYPSEPWKYEHGTTVLNNGNWQFLTWVNYSNGTMTMYVNGIPEKTGFSSLTSNGGPVNVIGRNWNVIFTVFAIDELRVNSRSYSDAEILALYNSTK